jgi:anti-sigma28 factor (negative regulator of flagellin synthesis)
MNIMLGTDSYNAINAVMKLDNQSKLTKSVAKDTTSNQMSSLIDTVKNAGNVDNAMKLAALSTSIKNGSYDVDYDRLVKTLSREIDIIN